MPILEDEQQFVVAGAIHLEFFPTRLEPNVTLLGIVAYFERFERDFLRLDFIVAARFCQARILIFILIDQRLETADHVLREILQVLAGLHELRFQFLQFFAMLVNVKERNATDTDLKQFIHIFIRDGTQQLLGERFKAVINCRDHRFVGFALFDLFVNALLDENTFQCAEMLFIQQFALPGFQLALVELHGLRGVLAKRLGGGHLHRSVVFDDRNATGKGNLAIGKGVESINQLL